MKAAPALAAALGLAALLLCAPAAAADWTEGLKQEWSAALARSTAAAEHAAFLRERDPPIEVGDFDQGDPAPLAANLDGRIRVNRSELERMREALVRQGASPEDVPRLLALKTLPLIAHELRHFMNREAVAQAAGAAFELPLAEDEASAFADQARLLRELESSQPELARHELPVDQSYRELLLDAKDGQEGLDRHVRKHYKIPSLLAASPEELLDGYRQAADAQRRRLSYHELMRQQLAFASTNQERLEIQSVMARLRPGEARRLLRNCEDAVRFLEDPARLAALSEHYRGLRER